KGVVEADDVTFEDLLPGVFARNAAEMDNAVASLHHALDGAHIGNVGLVNFLAVPRRRDRRQVGQAQDWIHTAQRFAQATASAPTSAGDQHSMHFCTRHSFLLIVVGGTGVISTGSPSPQSYLQTAIAATCSQSSRSVSS